MNNKKETKRLLINTALIAFGNLGAKLISFLLLPLYTSILTTSDYGIYDFIITVNGRKDTVTLSYEEYKKMKAHIELLELLAEAEDDVKNKRMAPISETFDDLLNMLQG